MLAGNELYDRKLLGSGKHNKYTISSCKELNFLAMVAFCKSNYGQAK